MSRIEEAILKVKAKAKQEQASQDLTVEALAPGASVTPGPAPAADSGSLGAGANSGRLDEAAAAVSQPAPAKRTITLDLDQLRAGGLLPPDADARYIANEFRAIKRTLMGNITGRAGTRIPFANIIMVASALPDEGKTFCAVNLALTLALEKDYSVVLIDGDVAKPNITRVLGLEDAPGLFDVLKSDTGALTDVEISTNVPRLSFVPAGGGHEDSVELLSSKRMGRLVEGMRSVQNCLYVFDSTPLLLTNESRVMSEIAGQVMLVVRAASTPRSAVKSAISHLPENVYIGVVLNRKDPASGGYYYHYGEYGRHGHSKE